MRKPVKSGSRARDVRVAHRLRLLVDRHRSLPSLRRERADRETPAPTHSLVHCAEATRLRPTSREACFFPLKGGVRLGSLTIRQGEVNGEQTATS